MFTQPFFQAARQYRRRTVARVLLLSLGAGALLLTALWATGSGAPPPAATAEALTVAADVERTYGSMPKGVTAEGVAQGFPPLAAVSYDGAANRFTLRDQAGNTLVYASPVSRADLKAIFAAIYTDHRQTAHLPRPRTRIGVSLRQDMSFIVFGELPKTSQVAKDLSAADRILGGTVYATPAFLRGVRLPRDYKPTRVRGKRSVWTAAQLNFHQFTFAAQPRGNTYQCVSYAVTPTLTPVIPGGKSDGGHARDEARIRQGIMGEREEVANFEFLKTNLMEFRQMPEFVRAGLIGEAAAFARLTLALPAPEQDQLLRSM